MAPFEGHPDSFVGGWPSENRLVGSLGDSSKMSSRDQFEEIPGWKEKVICAIGGKEKQIPSSQSDGSHVEVNVFR